MKGVCADTRGKKDAQNLRQTLSARTAVKLTPNGPFSSLTLNAESVLDQEISFLVLLMLEKDINAKHAVVFFQTGAI
ncbi:MAG: hypothetical protein N0E59_11215 [Candidatus Thiodiazotropha taylori]|nr:hypothetical protein [Candidatus Thiodiazotropha taylori]MCW4264505.1 hypothetical protein [Candidatus Thiodiazotropha endolucinida]MCG8048714.1 hypothetical protein [Candidatus Thiodiazotropha taylori]MCG8111319.1 hypothetical protein [Candidatus Thiodiazotropha taylori]MCW4283673.1 hypothetical protein [Candidatus Thiodiazotropha taylori]